MDPDVSVGPRLIQPTDRTFPDRLSDLPVPPRGLWVEGRTPATGEPVVAIVGSRAASRAASTVVRDLGTSLVRAGLAIVSGGALGIDAAAHRGALEGNGVTFAVLGCGIDVVYPDRHVELFRQIATRGGLLSEYGPGVSPRPGQFPARNRLVAALARAVIVGECHRGSGALITARQARALGRPLLAIPGSAGADGLLAAGVAAEVESAADVLSALAGQGGPRGARADRDGDRDGNGDGDGASGRANRLPPRIQVIVDTMAALSAAGDAPAAAETIAERAGLPLGEALGSLLEAELTGLVVRVPGGRFEVPRAE